MPTDPATIALYYSAAFLRQLKRLSKKYRRIRHDLEPLLEELQAGEIPGDQLKGTGHTVYKVRLANRDAKRGASGGYRVIYYVQTATGRLLLTIYSKSEQSDISVEDVQRIIQEELGH